MEEDNQVPLKRDIRRYYCDYCGICRSKKVLITSHMAAHHKEEMKKKNVFGGSEPGVESNTCEECGATFKKPSHLQQHKLSHSDERPFVCTFDGCNASYKRKDHLYVHLRQHRGKAYVCPIDGCKQEFSYKSNMKVHMKKVHSKDSPSLVQSKEKHICPEVGCGKAFKYASKLKKHADSHVKLDSVEAFCSEPTCMKFFTNEECLRAHVQSCHQYITCEVCGAKQLKKNIRRHLRTHESQIPSKRIKCDFGGCDHTFATKSNHSQHVKAVHYGHKPFACSFAGCGQRFSFKHVRDQHEKSGCHIFTPGDFLESDEQLLSMPRGGRKRVCPTVDMLLRKRVTPPDVDFMSEDVCDVQ